VGIDGIRWNEGQTPAAGEAGVDQVVLPEARTIAGAAPAR
jgi:hypothetical protein